MRAYDMPDQQTCSLVEGACDKAEKAIQKILLDLQDELGVRVVAANVDTRNYANCAVEIFVK